MKALLLLLCSLYAFASSAGEIVNRATSEKLDFKLDTENSLLLIESPESRVKSPMSAKRIEPQIDKSNYFPLTKKWVGLLEYTMIGSYEEAYLYPVFTPMTLVTNTLDLLQAPYQLVRDMIQNSKNKKDLRILLQAINTRDSVEVGPKRFERIIQLLEAQ